MAALTMNAVALNGRFLYLFCILRDGNKDASHGLPPGRRFQTMVNPRAAGHTGCASERKANGAVDKEPAWPTSLLESALL